MRSEPERPITSHDLRHLSTRLAWFMRGPSLVARLQLRERGRVNRCDRLTVGIGNLERDGGIRFERLAPCWQTGGAIALYADGWITDWHRCGIAPVRR